jgi:hypothetical protein
VTGKSVVSGISSTSSCWIGSLAMDELIGREQSWTAALFELFLGGTDRTNPTDRAKLGSKRHLICDGRGVPLAVQLTGANRNDSQQALALVDAIPIFAGRARTTAPSS